MSDAQKNPGGGASATEVPVGRDLPCLQEPELFFAESPQDTEQAKALCQRCRARVGCLTGALGRGEPWGIWGGELLVQGVVVPRKRPRGRPRKIDATVYASLSQEIEAGDSRGHHDTRGRA